MTETEYMALIDAQEEATGEQLPASVLGEAIERLHAPKRRPTAEAIASLLVAVWLDGFREGAK